MQYLQEHDKWVGDQMEDGHQPQLLLSLVSISRHSPTKGLEDQIRLARGGCRSEGPSPEVDALPSRILMSENLALGPHRSNHVLQRKLKQAAGGISDESPFAACFEPRRAPLASAKLTPTHPKSGPLELPFTFCAECNFLTSAPANKQIERVRH